MKKMVFLLSVFLLFYLLSGCVAHVTPEGTYLEPLPATIVIGPPVIGVESPRATYRHLPPVWLYPDRRVYSYEGAYYYNWNNNWYYSDREKGPWHHLPREYYPRESRERRDEDRDRYRDRDRDRDRDDDRFRDRPRY